MGKARVTEGRFTLRVPLEQRPTWKTGQDSGCYGFNLHKVEALRKITAPPSGARGPQPSGQGRAGHVQATPRGEAVLWARVCSPLSGWDHCKRARSAKLNGRSLLNVCLSLAGCPLHSCQHLTCSHSPGTRAVTRARVPAGRRQSISASPGSPSWHRHR